MLLRCLTQRIMRQTSVVSMMMVVVVTASGKNGRNNNILHHVYRVLTLYFTCLLTCFESCSMFVHYNNIRDRQVNTTTRPTKWPRIDRLCDVKWCHSVKFRLRATTRPPLLPPVISQSAFKSWFKLVDVCYAYALVDWDGQRVTWLVQGVAI